MAAAIGVKALHVASTALAPVRCHNRPVGSAAPQNVTVVSRRRPSYHPRAFRSISIVPGRASVLDRIAAAAAAADNAETEEEQASSVEATSIAAAAAETAENAETEKEQASSVEATLQRISALLSQQPSSADVAGQKLASVLAELEGSASVVSGDAVSKQLVVKDSPATNGEVDVITRLKQGFRRFKDEYYLKESQLFNYLSSTQTPKVLLVGCCDSRVCPDTVMGQNLGEIFTVRCIANLIPPFDKKSGGLHGVSAALEYAVLHLKVEHIIVLGHRRCGGIKALMSFKDGEKGVLGTDFIEDWMEIALPARQRTLKNCADKPFDQQCDYCEKESVNCSLTNLLTFPWINEAVSFNRLQLHGWYYDFVDGTMDTWTYSLSTTNKELVS